MDKILKGAKFLLWYKDPALFFRDIFKMEPYPYQAKVLRNLKNNPHRIIIMAAGGTGKTRLLACIALWLTTVLPKFINRPYSVIIISGSDQQAKYLYEYSRFAIKDNEILSEEVEGEPLISITYFKDRSLIMAVPNSLKAIQGKHCDCCLVDEGALAGDFIIQDTLRIVSTSDRDLIILSGTPMIYGTMFVNIWEEKDKYPEWEHFSWSAKECPFITQEKWNEATKLPEDVFSIFWEGKPYAKIGTMIPSDEIRASSKDVQVMEIDPKYEIVGGLDWGFIHYTALAICQLNKETGKINLLYLDYWSREQFEDMHEKIIQVCKDFNVSRIFADSLPEDEPIIIRLNGRIETVLLKELANIHGNIEILGQGNEFRKLNHIVSHFYNGPLLEIRTINGIIRVSPNHPMILRNGRVRRADQIKIGDQLASTPNNLPSNLYSNYFIGNEKYAFSLGLFLAEGSVHKDLLSLSMTNKNLVKEFKENIEQETNTSWNISKYKNKNNFIWNTNCRNSRLADYFKEMFYDSKKEKKVPNKILNAPKNIKKAFLDGYNSGDGSRNEIFKITDKSRHVIAGLVYLLRNTYKKGRKELGSYSVYHSKDRNYFSLRFNTHKNKIDPYRVLDIKSYNYNGYLYDLEVDKHVFSAGIGFIKVHNSEDIGENQRLISKGINVIPINFKNIKIQMQSHMKVMFHLDKIRIPEKYQKLIQQLRKYNWNSHEDDDLVVALMLAIWALKEEKDSYYFEVL
jgi:hypothetical protein